MKKILVLKFKDAKCFQNKKTKDFVFDIDGQRKRCDEQFFVEPITVHQISNVLHTLFGERPVPTLRKSLFSGIDYYFQKAENSYLKYESPKKTSKKTGEEDYITEILKVKKSIWNSWNPDVYINWEIIRRYTHEHFDWFVQTLNDTIKKDVQKMPFEEVRAILEKNEKNKFSDFFTELKKLRLGGIYDYIYNPETPSRLTSNFRTAVTVVGGVEKVINLSGTILVPVSEEDIQKLSMSKGCATILDGGFVWIDSIQSINSVSGEDYIQVKKISTQKF